MASWFIIAIASIAAIGIIMLSGVNLISVMAAETGQTDAIAKFNQLPELILANSWQAPDGTIYLPAASPAGPGDIEGVASLPSWLRQRGVLATSAQVIYCPFAPVAAAPNADLFNPDGSRYGVEVTINAARRYITGGRPNYADAASNRDLMGFVMIPDNREGTYSGCNAITRAGTAYTAPGMIVRPILLSQATDERAALSNVKVIYATATGAGTGDTASSPTNLSAALARWRASSWANTRIEFTGSATLAVTDLRPSGGNYVAKPANSTLTINGTGRSPSRILFATPATIDVPVNLNLLNLSISRNAIVAVAPRHKLQVENALIGPVALGANSQGVIMNSEVRNDSSSAMGSTPVFNIETGARLTLTGAVTYANVFTNILAVVESGGAFDIVQADVTIDTNIASRHEIATGGTMRVISSSMLVTLNGGSTFNSSGQLLFSASTFTNNALNMSQAVMSLGPGSRTHINGSTISVPNRAAAQRSIRSLNAGSVSGNTSTIQGCWDDFSGPPVFALSAEPVTGVSSRVTDDTPDPVLSATPTVAEIQGLTKNKQRTFERATARLRNTSDWTCSL